MLPVLLSKVLGGLTAEITEPSLPSLAVWSNVLRCVRDGVSERDLPAAARISKRLAVSAVTGAARRGWITVEKCDRGRSVSLTEPGRTVDLAWQRRLTEVDQCGSKSSLRAALETLVGQLTVELPWYPASYGAVDPSVVGGTFAPPEPGLNLPAHGQDWRWVLRNRDADTVSTLPITALLSQALVAFTIDYEAQQRWSLASTTLVVRHLTAEPRPLNDVPGEHGIAGNGRSLLERHGVAVVTADPDNPKRQLVQLTPRGQQIMSRHNPLIAGVEQTWCDRYGVRVVDGLRAALEAQKWASDAALPDHVVAPLHRG